MEASSKNTVYFFALDPLDVLRFAVLFFRVFRFDAEAGREARSGSFLRPVSRFHSSNVSFEILPSTRS
jgi:hypothetical protein